MWDGIAAFLQAINDAPMAQEIRDSPWMFPAIETVHVIAIAFVVGSITRVDMRLMGLLQKHRPVTTMADEMLPYTWTSFAIAAVFGALLWASKPFAYLGIVFFNVKMILIVLAGLNMLYFQLVTWKTVAQWDRAPSPPFSARFAGALSLVFWVSIVVSGRFIGFV